MTDTKKESHSLATNSPRQSPKPSNGNPATKHSIPHRRRKANKIRPAALIIGLACALTLVVLAVIAATRPAPEPVADIELTHSPEAITASEAVAEPTIATSETTHRYELTDSERGIVESVVMAEAEGEPYEGQIAVAQCILAACEKDGIRPEEAVKAYKYAKTRPEPSSSIIAAVSAVFDDGETITDEPILYFYNPARATSSWHESQIFVIEIEHHRFFAERGADK